ncbi:hypothetical protein [Companilactobacillus insicii]|uniref:hypothetical protein n=1 Tax=Companilactobacillus insicii TaxID=1732567 RepID=UPI000F785863|nr:hypothetical protein [Companilactobacillus insicii]
MRINKIRLFYIVFFVFASIALTLSLNTRVAKAINVIDLAARKSAPQGLSLDDSGGSESFFTKVNTLGTSGATTNSAMIYRGPNAEYPDSDMVQLTDATHQVSSIWSDNDKGNYLDTTKHQTMSMWLYFGIVSAPTAGDGIAFVLQNGGPDAIAINPVDNDNGDSKAGEAGKGETMGVWAVDTDKNQSSSDALAKSAIQNSWALEFDTYSNTDSLPGRGTYYDAGIETYLKGKQHIASGYPGEGSTYKRYGNSSSGYYYSMVHNNLHSNLQLSGFDNPKSAWHHLTIDYEPPVSAGDDATLTYHFNDKNYDGSNKPATSGSEITQIENIDLSKFHFAKDANGVTQTKLRYGFTGSTGQTSSTNFAVFETMPSLVEANSESKIYDVTQNKRLIEDGDKNVHDGDKMQFNYNLNYESGEKDLNKIIATINLPSNMTYATDGNIGQIEYADGTTEDIPASENNNGVVKHTLSKSLNNSLNSAKIKIFANAKISQSNGSDVATDVATTHSVLAGDLYKGDINTAAFTISPSKKMVLNTNKDTIDVDGGKNIQLTGTNNYSDNSVIHDTDVKYYSSIDGHDPIVGAYTDDNQGLTIPFILSIPYQGNESLLKPGKHDITVYAMDKNYNTSNTLTYHVTVNDVTLNAKADNSTVDVSDDEPVPLSGTLTHSNGSSIESGTTKIYATVTYSDLTKSDEKEFDTTVDSNGKFSIDLKPYAYDMNSGTAQSVTYDDYVSNSSYEKGLLKLGTNIVTLRIVDPGKHEAKPVTYTVNVPEATPELKTDESDKTFLDSDFEVPATISMPDNYEYRRDNFKFSVDSNNINKVASSTLSQISVSGSQDMNLTGDLNDWNITPSSTQKYNMNVLATDVYGRKSNVLNYTFNYLDKLLQLNSGDYSFKTTEMYGTTNGIVQRNGKWNLNVESYKTNWSLSATGSDFYKTNEDNTKTKLDGNLVFVDNNGQSHVLDGQEIASDDSGSPELKKTDVSDWSDNKGVLLDLHSSTVSGTFAGTIDWNLVDSI